MSQATAQSLVYEQPGDPPAVLSVRSASVGDVGKGEVLLKILAAPINPSDVNTVQGKYPLQPSLPGVPGHEGVGEVVAVGAGVTTFKPGDWAVPLTPAQGTWRTHGVFKAADWHPIPNDIPLEAAATLTINPPTALGMLESYVELQPGDVVIQNGANSAVGQAVIQLARAKNLKTINIIRNRPDWEATVQQLKELGADLVTTEEKVKNDAKAAGLAAPAVGFNCVGGSSGTAVAKMLRHGGTMVTYGGMSMQPVVVPTSLFIFKDIKCAGFWLSGSWGEKLGAEGKARLLTRLAEYVRGGELAAPRCEMVPFDKWQEALKRLEQGYVGTKLLLQMP